MMRTTFTILAVASGVLFLGANEASAQRFGRGRGNGVIISSGYGNGGYYGYQGYGNGFIGGSGYRPFNNGFGIGFNSSPFGYYGASQGYYGSNYGYYSPSTYYSPSAYYETQPVYSSPSSPIIPTTYSQAAPMPIVSAESQYGTVMVNVPTTDTQVWFGNTPMSQQGMERQFHTPNLVAGNHSYQVKARWVADGKQMEDVRHIDVRAGQKTAVDFRKAGHQVIPAPEKHSSR